MTTTTMVCKRMITNKFPLSTALPPLASAFTVKSHLTVPSFCTQISAPFTTPPVSGVATEFLINECGLTLQVIAKAFRHNNGLLRAKSIQNMKEVLELLKGRGLTTPAQIQRVVICNPRLLFLSTERNIQSKLNLFKTFMTEEDVTKLVIRNARIFSCGEDKLKSAISLLQRLVAKGQLSELVVKEPRFLVVSEEKVLESFKHVENFGYQKGSKMFIAALCAILGVGKEKIERRLQSLSSLGFSEKQVSGLLRRWPVILALPEESVKHHVDFLVKPVGISLDKLVQNPALFGYSLEKRLIPRHRVIEALKSMQALKTEKIYPRIFFLPEKRFLEIYVDNNADSSIMRDIYQSGKVDH